MEIVSCLYLVNYYDCLQVKGLAITFKVLHILGGGYLKDYFFLNLFACSFRYASLLS